MAKIQHMVDPSLFDNSSKIFYAGGTRITVATSYVANATEVRRQSGVTGYSCMDDHSTILHIICDKNGERLEFCAAQHGLKNPAKFVRCTYNDVKVNIDFTCPLSMGKIINGTYTIDDRWIKWIFGDLSKIVLEKLNNPCFSDDLKTAIKTWNDKNSLVVQRDKTHTKVRKLVTRTACN